jgi:hypothetical protein
MREARALLPLPISENNLFNDASQRELSMGQRASGPKVREDRTAPDVCREAAP